MKSEPEEWTWPRCPLRSLPFPSLSIRAISTAGWASFIVLHVLVYAVVDDSLSRNWLGDSVDVFVRPDDAECFIEEVRGDDPNPREGAANRGARAPGWHVEQGNIRFMAELVNNL